MFKNLLKPSNVSVQNVRTYIKHYKWNGEGIKYPGFTYYPRKPDFKDPEYEASKLFRVQRIKPLKGNPHWEKEILKCLKLDGKQGDVAIVKNIPEMNALLWKVKHLIKISPITFPNGLPNENELDCTFLNENGQLLVQKRLQPSKETLIATKKFEEDPRRLDGNTLRRNSRLKWLSGWSNSL